jgi:hypothetical protein
MRLGNIILGLGHFSGTAVAIMNARKKKICTTFYLFLVSLVYLVETADEEENNY